MLYENVRLSALSSINTFNGIFFSPFLIMSTKAKKTTNTTDVLSDACKKVAKKAASGRNPVGDGECNEQNKSGFTWSVVSEDGERIPGKSINALPNGSGQKASKTNSSETKSESLEHSGVVSFPHNWELADLFADKQQTFDPEIMLRKLEAERAKLEESFNVADCVAEKKPSAAFRTCLNDEFPCAIGVPREMLQAGGLLSDKAISETLKFASGEVSSRMKTAEEMELDELVDLWTTLSQKTKKRILGIAKKI